MCGGGSEFEISCSGPNGDSDFTFSGDIASIDTTSCFTQYDETNTDLMAVSPYSSDSIIAIDSSIGGCNQWNVGYDMYFDFVDNQMGCAGYNAYAWNTVNLATFSVKVLTGSSSGGGWSTCAGPANLADLGSFAAVSSACGGDGFRITCSGPYGSHVSSFSTTDMATIGTASCYTAYTDDTSEIGAFTPYSSDEIIAIDPSVTACSQWSTAYNIYMDFVNNQGACLGYNAYASTVGDVTFTVETINGASSYTPCLADFYISSYSFAEIQSSCGGGSSFKLDCTGPYGDSSETFALDISTIYNGVCTTATSPDGSMLAVSPYSSDVIIAIDPSVSGCNQWSTAYETYMDFVNNQGACMGYNAYQGTAYDVAFTISIM